MAEEETRRALEALQIERDAPPPPRSLWRIPALAGAGVALALGLVWWWSAERAPLVEVAYARRSGGAAPGALSATGYVVTGRRYISLGVRVPGRVAAYRVEEGEAVERGQALVQLDDRQYRAALRQARAALRVSQADLELKRLERDRLRELRERDIASQAQLDLAETRHSIASAEGERLAARIAELEVALEDTVVRAPAPGVVLEKFKEVGEIATPGGFAGSGELIRMANLEEIRVEADVAEADLSRVRLGQPARLRPDAWPEREYSARVVKIYPQINRQKGTVRVEARVDEPDDKLLPDMSVRIDFFDAPAGAAPEPAEVLAPLASVRRDAAGAFAWEVRDGRVRRRPLETGGERDGLAVALRGLAGGEALVVGPAPDLSEGTQVRTAPAP